MRPLVQKKLKFNNCCGAIVDTELLEKAMIWKAENVIFSIRKIFMHQNYPAVSIDGKKYHIHRLIISFTEKRELSSLEYVHHVDGNEHNSTVSNLEIMAADDHIRKHLSGKKQDKEFAIRRTDAACLAKYGKHTRKWKEINIHDTPSENKRAKRRRDLGYDEPSMDERTDNINQVIESLDDITSEKGQVKNETD